MGGGQFWWTRLVIQAKKRIGAQNSRALRRSTRRGFLISQSQKPDGFLGHIERGSKKFIAFGELPLHSAPRFSDLLFLTARGWLLLHRAPVSTGTHSSELGNLDGLQRPSAGFVLVLKGGLFSGLPFFIGAKIGIGARVRRGRNGANRWDYGTWPSWGSRV